MTTGFDLRAASPVGPRSTFAGKRANTLRDVGLYATLQLQKLKMRLATASLARHSLFELLSWIPLFYYRGFVGGVDHPRMAYDLARGRAVKIRLDDKNVGHPSKEHDGYCSDIETLDCEFGIKIIGRTVFRHQISDVMSLNIKRFCLDLNAGRLIGLRRDLEGAGLLPDPLQGPAHGAPFHVFEPGCNAGGFLGLFAALGNIRVTGCDLHEPSIRAASSFIPAGTFHVTDLFSLDWLRQQESRRFDLLFCSRHLIYAVARTNLEAYVNELLRVSRAAVFLESDVSDIREALLTRGFSIKRCNGGTMFFRPASDTAER